MKKINTTNEIKDNKNSNRIKKIFKIMEKQTQVCNNASAKHKEIMQKHQEYTQEVKSLLHEIWDDVDPLDQN